MQVQLGELGRTGAYDPLMGPLPIVPTASAQDGQVPLPPKVGAMRAPPGCGRATTPPLATSGVWHVVNSTAAGPVEVTSAAAAGTWPDAETVVRNAPIPNVVAAVHVVAEGHVALAAYVAEDIPRIVRAPARAHAHTAAVASASIVEVEGVGVELCHADPRAAGGPAARLRHASAALAAAPVPLRSCARKPLCCGKRGPAPRSRESPAAPSITTSPTTAFVLTDITPTNPSHVSRPVGPMVAVETKSAR